MNGAIYIPWLTDEMNKHFPDGIYVDDVSYGGDVRYILVIGDMEVYTFNNDPYWMVNISDDMKREIVRIVLNAEEMLNAEREIREKKKREKTEAYLSKYVYEND